VASETATINAEDGTPSLPRLSYFPSGIEADLERLFDLANRYQDEHERLSEKIALLRLSIFSQALFIWLFVVFSYVLPKVLFTASVFKQSQSLYFLFVFLGGVLLGSRFVSTHLRMDNKKSCQKDD